MSNIENAPAPPVLKRTLHLCFFSAITTVLLLIVLPAEGQPGQLPEIKLPDIPYKPTATKGWTGQFVYQLKFDDSTSVGKGKNRKYCHVIVNRVNSGYIELTNEIRGAIRSNQPDKNNPERYESWINSGTKSTWSLHDETDTIIEPSGNLVTDAITGRVEKYSRYTSGDTWVKGWLENADLQIDHVTGKYSFAVPMPVYQLEGDETLVIVTYNPANKEVKPAREKKRHGLINIPYFTYGKWDMLEGTCAKDQKEIVFRERIPVTLTLTQLQGTKTVTAPPKKGFIDFYLVLKKG